MSSEQVYLLVNHDRFWLRQQKIIVCHDMVLFLKTFVVPGVLFRSKQVCLFCSEQVWLILQIIYFENVPHNVVLKAFL